MKRLRLPPHLQAIVDATPTNAQRVARALGNLKGTLTSSTQSLTLLPTTGKPGPWLVEIPGWRAATVNDLLRLNPLPRNGRKKRDAKVLANACLLAGVPRATTKRRVTLTLRYPKGQCRPDRDNALKSLLDGLVTAGALVDDSERWVWTEAVRFEVGAKGTVVLLEEMGDE